MFSSAYIPPNLVSSKFNLKVIKIALSLLFKKKNYILIRFVLLSFVVVQWTGAGVTLETGTSAVQNVAAAL